MIGRETERKRENRTDLKRQRRRNIDREIEREGWRDKRGREK